MLKDFVNLRTLDRFHQIGRYAQLVGALLIVAPSLAAIMSALMPPSTPNFLLDPLPEFSPSAVAYRHPLWVAAGSVPLGVIAVVIGTQFLSRRPWARQAMTRLCWFGVGLCLLEGALFGLSALTVRVPVVIGFAVTAVLMCCFFAYILYGATRDLTSPDIVGQFDA